MLIQHKAWPSVEVRFKSPKEAAEALFENGKYGLRIAMITEEGKIVVCMTEYQNHAFLIEFWAKALNVQYPWQYHFVRIRIADHRLHKNYVFDDLFKHCRSAYPQELTRKQHDVLYALVEQLEVFRAEDGCTPALNVNGLKSILKLGVRNDEV